MATATGWSLFSWLGANGVIGALSVAVEMMIVLIWVTGKTEPRSPHDWVMAAMVGMIGGTLGG